jgi:hypothetical protein
MHSLQSVVVSALLAGAASGSVIEKRAWNFKK